MVLYELFCIASHNPQTPQNLRGLIQNIARKVHLQGGVVREVKGLGIGLTLPERMQRNQQNHDIGDHFTMLFDTSPLLLKRLNAAMRRDPQVIRWTFLKKGDGLKNVNPPAPSTISELGPEQRGMH